MKRYTYKQAEKMLGISYRAVRYYTTLESLQSEVVRVDNKPFVTERFIELVKHSQRVKGQTIKETKEELVQMVDDLKSQIEMLEEQNDDLKRLIETLEEQNDDLKRLIETLEEQNDDDKRQLDELVSTESETEAILRKEISELKEEILSYEDSSIELPTDEEGILELIGELYNRLKGLGSTDRIEFFSEEEYKVFETRLIEWRTQKDKIADQEVRFEEVKASKDEVIAHYKNQFEYQRQIADKQLEQMDKLITYLRERGQREGERAHIEAVEKKIIPREYNSNNDDPYRSSHR